MARTKAAIKATRPKALTQIAKKQNITRKARPSITNIKKPHRFRPGTQALREIKKCQKSTNLLIPRLAFQRLVREIANDFKDELRFERKALEAIQEATEAHVIELLGASSIIAIHTGRVGIKVQDLKVAQQVRKIDILTPDESPMIARVRPPSNNRKAKPPTKKVIVEPSPITISQMEEEPTSTPIEVPSINEVNENDTMPELARQEDVTSSI